MVPADVGNLQGILEPSIMGPPIVWLASEEAATAHDERIVAVEFDGWLHDWRARRADGGA
jgi:gluconate 5-dehydrogenase